MKGVVLLLRMVVLGALIAPVLARAGTTAWLGPVPPGDSYPAGDAHP
jgi:hypothetical protein